MAVFRVEKTKAFNESVVNAFCGHIKKSPCNRSCVQMDVLHPLARRGVSGVSPQN